MAIRDKALWLTTRQWHYVEPQRYIRSISKAKQTKQERENYQLEKAGIFGPMTWDQRHDMGPEGAFFSATVTPAWPPASLLGTGDLCRWALMPWFPCAVVGFYFDHPICVLVHIFLLSVCLTLSPLALLVSISCEATTGLSHLTCGARLVDFRCCLDEKNICICQLERRRQRNQMMPKIATATAGGCSKKGER